MRIVVALLAVLAMSTVASANVQVWFDVSPVSGNVVVNSGPGTAGASVDVTVGPGAASMLVDIYLTAGVNPISGYTMVFNEDGPCEGILSDQLIDEFDPDWGVSLSDMGADHWSAIYATVTGAPIAPLAQQHIGSFILTKPNPLIDDNFIWGNSVPSGMGYWGNGGESIQWGASSAIPPYGAPYYYSDTPMLTVHCVPEPATIALLGLGVVALIRRR